MWVERFSQALPALITANPTARFVFLTLTQRNVAIADLRATLRHMSHAWAHLSQRQAFKVLGSLRTTEVTRGKDGTAHPHFHVLLMVPSNYFTKNYVKQPEWVRMWREALRIDYDPVVDVRPIRSARPQAAGTTKIASSMMAATRETVKYSVKPADMKADVSWFLELTKQLQKLRFIASSGLLKDILKSEKESDEDLMLLRGEEKSAERASMFFDWHRPVKRYKRGSESAIHQVYACHAG